MGEIARKILDQAVWKYTSVLLAQPFDVAKTILQGRLAAASEADAEGKAQNRMSLGSDVDRRYPDVCAHNGIKSLGD